MTGTCKSRFTFEKESQIEDEKTQNQTTSASSTKNVGVGAGVQGFEPTVNVSYAKMDKHDNVTSGTESATNLATNTTEYKICNLRYAPDSIKGTFTLFFRDHDEKIQLNELRYDEPNINKGDKQNPIPPTNPIVTNTAFSGYRAFCDGTSGFVDSENVFIFNFMF